MVTINVSNGVPRVSSMSSFLLKQNIIYRPQSKSSANNLVKYDSNVYNK